MRIELTNRGFADLCLTTWLRRRVRKLAWRKGFLKPLDCGMPRAAILVLTLLLPACSAVLGTRGLTVAITAADGPLTPARPLVITVTAVNQGEERVVWGQGSSSCQLTAEVLDAGVYYPIGDRVCTADYGPQGLDPGASRTETWEWDGTYRRDDGAVTLQSGAYQIRGRAGDATSLSITVTIAAAGGA